MAHNKLTVEFRGLQSQIDLEIRRRIVIAAHTEVRDILSQSSRLSAMQLDARLVGSYARRVAIWPGKDVDILGLVAEPDTDDPGVLHGVFGDALEAYESQGRLRAQPRSWLIDFGGDRLPGQAAVLKAARELHWTQTEVKDVEAAIGGGAFPFTVDVVPARPAGENYEIPQVALVRDDGRIVIDEQRRIAKQMTGEWLETNPLALNDETTKRNGELLIGGRGAFVPLVKHLRQIRTAHLSGVKPSSLLYEFALHEGVTSGRVAGDSWADLTKAAIDYVWERLTELDSDPVLDPVLREPYSPSPSAGDLATAVGKWREIARRANTAVIARDRCTAANAWQFVFGKSERTSPLPVFPTPPGCTGTGNPYGAAAGGVGANAAREGREERGFGAQ